jgi:hypothetical protein
MPEYIKVGSEIKKVKNIYIKDSGTIKSVKEKYVNVSGVTQKVFSITSSTNTKWTCTSATGNISGISEGDTSTDYEIAASITSSTLNTSIVLESDISISSGDLISYTFYPNLGLDQDNSSDDDDVLIDIHINDGDADGSDYDTYEITRKTTGEISYSCTSTVEGKLTIKIIIGKPTNSNHTLVIDYLYLKVNGNNVLWIHNAK